MKLYDAIKVVIGSLGPEVIMQRTFSNALNDFQAFAEVPAARHVLSELVSEGYGGKLYDIYSSRDDWQSKMTNLVAGFTQRHGYKDDLVVYVFMSVAYGLGWVQSVEDYVPSQNGVYVGEPEKDVETTVYHTSKLEIEIDMTPSLNLALQQHHVPLVNSLKIKNVSAEVFTDISIVIQADPGFAEVWKGHVAELQPLQDVKISSIPLTVSPTYLANLTEGVSGHLRLQVGTPQALLFDYSFPVELDAYDQWCGLAVEPKVLASFVMPRHPALTPVLSRASAILEKWTGNPTFDEYQTRNSNRVKMQIAAVYEVLAELNTIGSVSSVDYTKSGERVRFPDVVLGTKMASELDMALTFASFLETIGLHALIAFTEDAVLVGGWLIPDTFVDAVSDDVTLLTKRLAKGIEEVVFVNTKCLFAGNYANFDNAVSEAFSALSDTDRFLLVLDVCRARMSRVRPLPTRVIGEHGYEVVVDEDGFEAEKPMQVSADDLIWDYDAADVTKQTIWERRLLDLSLRNSLLNTRISKRTLQIISLKVDEIEDALANGQEFKICPRPEEMSDPVDASGIYHVPNDVDAITDLLKEEIRQNRLHSYLKEDDLNQVLTRLYRQARLAIEENGANTLFLAIGLMRWFETPSSTVPRFAPILLFPIEIIRKSVAKGYIIRSRGEETMMNITLLEMLRQKFGIVINGLDPLPEDRMGVDVVKVFSIIRKAIMEQSRWEVEEQAVIGSFSFNKFLMWNDIHNNVDVLRRNKIVNGLISGTVDWGNDIQEDIDLDETFSVGDLALPMAADSSQIEAISAALGEKSFVLHGPPGTGKSQTITNIIANALYRGKKVLFVAEKMAALQVVQHRLETIGLAPFCLELHSNKAKKSTVIEQLKRTTEVTRKNTGRHFQREAAQLNALRQELNGYVTALHKPYPAGLSLYDCFSLYCSVVEFASAEPLRIDGVGSLNEDDLQAFATWIHEYAAICDIIGNVAQTPLLPCKNAHYQPSLKSDLQRVLNDLKDQAETCKKHVISICDGLKLNFIDEKPWLEEFGQMYSMISQGATFLPNLLSSSNLEEDMEKAHRLVAVGKSMVVASDRICSELDPSLLELDTERAQKEWNCVHAFADGYQPVGKCQRQYGLVEAFEAIPNLYYRCVRDEVPHELFGVLADTLTAGEMRDLVAVCKDVLRLETVIPALLSEDDNGKSASALSELLDHCEQRNRYRTQILQRFRPSVFDLQYADLQAQWNESLRKFFIFSWFGQRKVVKLLNLHALEPISRDDVPNVLMLLRNHAEEQSYVSKNADFGKLLLGVDWKDGNPDVAVLQRTISTQASIFRGLLSMTQNKREASCCASQLLAKVDGNVAHFQAMNDKSIEQFIRSFMEFDDACQCFSGFGVSDSEMIGLIKEYQHCRGQIDGNRVEGERLFGGLWQPEARRWDVMEDALACTKQLCDHVGKIEPDAQRQLQVRSNLATVSLQEFDFHSVLSMLPSLGEECDRLLCGKLVMTDNGSFLEGFIARSTMVLDHLDGLKDICKYNQIVNAMPSPAFKAMVGKVESGEVSNALIELYYKKCLALTYAEYILSQETALNGFHGMMFEEKIAQYRKLCDRFERLTREELYAKLASNMPNFQIEAANNSEVGILQRNIRNGARGISLRSLFDKIPDLLTRICPCMLMSPISVAQYINANGAKFDYVIFDEASQMPTCEAVGAIARGNNVIVVGDPHQLPPTSFFETNAFDEENADKEDLESILDDCLALSMPSKYLLWHYRSKHESLIAFSNMKYYGNRLMTFPSPDDLTSKVTFQYVQGVYDKGRTRQNREEALAVIDEIRKRLSDPVLSQQSIGVVTFNTNQQSLIEDLLNDLFQNEPALEQIAMDGDEPIFVKNLENVQGDERDVILFSVGYGTDKTGKVSMNFGPLNRDGGWRRLNVAVSRARYEMKVFSALTPDQIDLSRTSAEGVAGLKAFLEYAMNGRLSLAYEAVSSKSTNDHLVLSVAEAIREQGFEVRTNIGTSGYRVDVGVVDPNDKGKYLVGILCDGYNYHTAKSARDREITRGTVLKLLGWRICRVWAMEWWEDRDNALRKLMADIDSAIKGTWDDKEPELEPLPPVTDDVLGQSENVSKAVPYRKAELMTIGNVTPDEIVSGSRAYMIINIFDSIIRAEAPVSKKVLLRRTNAVLGIARTGPRLAAYFDAILKGHAYPFTVVDDDVFYWIKNQEPRLYDVYRPDSDREALEIAPEEVAVAVCEVLDQQGALPEDDLLRQTAKLFNFSRMGDCVMASMIRGVDKAVEFGKAVREDGKVKICNNK